MQSLIILLMKDLIQSEVISQILEKPYQFRSHHEHKILESIIHSCVPHCSVEDARKLSFFVEQYNPEMPLTYGSILLVRSDKHSNNFEWLTYHHQPSLYETIGGKYCLVITNQDLHKRNVIAATIEEEVKCLQKSDYFQDVPKKRFYSIIKNASVLLFNYGEFVFSNLDPATATHEIYFSRKGEFSYEIKDEIEQKQIEILTFKEGHIFNQSNQFHFATEAEQYQRLPHELQKRRKLSVRCKSSKGIIYKLSKEYFASHLLKYCEAKLQDNSSKFNELLQERIQYIQKHRKVNNKFLVQKFYRSASAEIQSLIAEKVSTSRKSSVVKEPEPVLDISEKNQDYRSLKNEQAPRNRLYSKAELIKLTFNPQKNESDLLLWKKSKCLRLREISRSVHPPLGKAETMLKFIKSVVLFEKQRKKPLIL